MKSIIYLLVLSLVLSVGCSLAQTDMSGNTSSTDNMTGMMDNMTVVDMCNLTGIMTLTPVNMTGDQAGNITDNQTGNQTGGMVGSQEGVNMTEGQTYNITATVLCMPEAVNNMTGGTQAGNETEGQTGNLTGNQTGGNITGMNNMTGAKICYITGIATSIPEDMTGNQTENMTGNQTENMTVGKTYDITATVSCMSESMKNMTGNQTGNMTVVDMCNLTGIMTLTPANMTGNQTENMTGNQTENMTGDQTANMTEGQNYDITATVLCIPKAMNNTTGAKICEITGTAVSMPANMIGDLLIRNMTGSQSGNMTVGQTYDITATALCIPKTMNNVTGDQTGNMTGY